MSLCVGDRFVCRSERNLEVILIQLILLMTSTGFYSENKFEKLVRLVGFIIRTCHDARSSGCQKSIKIINVMRLFLLYKVTAFTRHFLLFHLVYSVLV